MSARRDRVPLEPLDGTLDDCFAGCAGWPVASRSPELWRCSSSDPEDVRLVGDGDRAWLGALICVLVAVVWGGFLAWVFLRLAGAL